MKFIAPLLTSVALLAAPAMADHHGETAHTEQTASLDIVETATAAGSFNTLLAAAGAADLVDALKGDGPLTVFAPTDEAFAALPEGTVATLLEPENKDKLAGILKLHVIAGAAITSDQLAGQQIMAETLNGSVSIDGTDGVTVNGANVVAADIEASNGVIHVIDAVLLPDAPAHGS